METSEQRRDERFEIRKIIALRTKEHESQIPGADVLLKRKIRVRRYEQVELADDTSQELTIFQPAKPASGTVRTS